MSPSRIVAYRPSTFAWFCIFFLCCSVHGQLDYKFYDDACPNLTRIVRYGVWSAIYNETRMAASILRLHFHDCFVNVITLLISYAFLTFVHIEHH